MGGVGSIRRVTKSFQMALLVIAATAAVSACASTIPLEVTEYRTVEHTTLALHYGPCAAEVEVTAVETDTSVEVSIEATYLPPAGDHIKCGRMVEVHLSEPLGSRSVTVVGFPDIQHIPDIDEIPTTLEP